MVTSSIGLVEKYDMLAPKFKAAYAFLRQTNVAELPVQTLALSPDLTVQVKEYDTKPPEETPFETHDKMFDIQYVVSGEELFGIAPRDSLEETEPYSNEKDITFYRDPPQYGSLLLRPGDLVVVSPDEAHKPGCMTGKPSPVKKIIIKVRAH
ncbi:MAG: YhcH/YjgK/YiaL family protein [Spirochaetaceae bacterium]|jgi:YhcH/YjgK/YiaL family protein|nr:YhcH/YjgK/YiaL family protein [Spirochaetaceae bacterium]